MPTVFYDLSPEQKALIGRAKALRKTLFMNDVEQKEIAESLGISRGHLSMVLTGKFVGENTDQLLSDVERAMNDILAERASQAA